MLASIDTKMAPHERSAERVRMHPPVNPGPEMPLGHLSVYAPFARRLSLDHGEDAQAALRETLLILLKAKGRRLTKHPRPYGMVLDANRIDHREALAEGVLLQGRSIVMHGIILPQQMLVGVIGCPITRVISHPLLDAGMIIVKAHSEKSSERHRNGVTVLETQGRWISGDLI